MIAGGDRLEIKGIIGDIQATATATSTARVTATKKGKGDDPSTVEIGSADWGRDLTFSTVTGNVDVEVPASTNAGVNASVVTGSISSVFPLTQTGPGEREGTLGTGGPLLTLSTVTGNVRLRRGL
jgi:hypothetical protein